MSMCDISAQYLSDTSLQCGPTQRANSTIFRATQGTQCSPSEIQKRILFPGDVLLDSDLHVVGRISRAFLFLIHFFLSLQAFSIPGSMYMR